MSFITKEKKHKVRIFHVFFLLYRLHSWNARLWHCIFIIFKFIVLYMTIISSVMASNSHPPVSLYRRTDSFLFSSFQHSKTPTAENDLSRNRCCLKIPIEQFTPTRRPKIHLILIKHAFYSLQKVFVQQKYFERCYDFMSNRWWKSKYQPTKKNARSCNKRLIMNIQAKIHVPQACECSWLRYFVAFWMPFSIYFAYQKWKSNRPFCCCWIFDYQLIKWECYGPYFTHTHTMFTVSPTHFD